MTSVPMITPQRNNPHKLEGTAVQSNKSRRRAPIEQNSFRSAEEIQPKQAMSVANLIAMLVGDSLGDSVTMEEAIENDRLGLPAFWHRGLNGKSCWLACQIANDQEDLAAALEWAREAEAHHPYVTREFMLDRLVPLNHAALTQMEAAYAELDLWRDDLHARSPA